MKEMGKEELKTWLRYVYFHSDDKKNLQAYNQIKKLISDYDQNLTDCTEAIDALIEERDALIEHTHAYDERIDEIVEHYRRLDSEPSGMDVESLSRQFHEVYQIEAKRQGDVRHPDDYDKLSENTKEYDRVLARYVIKQLLSQKQPSEDWLPTAEHINALPKGMKDYICGIETMSDPQWMIQQNILMKDTIRQLRDKILSQKRVVD